jgi:general secretion pathway protein M
MKQWWQNLSRQEKQTVSAGSILVAIFIIYTCIWYPLDHKVTTMRTQITQNQKLLAWMKAADAQLENVQHQAQITSSGHSSASLLSLAQSQIKQSTLATQNYQLRQTENDAVQLSFKQVDFDNLVTWLTDS